jgi:ParB-like chromosome segregation protein Spo0J
MTVDEIKKSISDILENKEFDEKVSIINEIREHIHYLSPFKNEPVDFVKWVNSEDVVANDYNPNKVAPPEMELLEISIMNDGYTQPIVTFPNNNKIEVIDGFHRNRVGKESIIVRERIKGFLPTVKIKSEQSDKNNRIASTIRHNRARGKHVVDAMSEIVLELKNRNWKNERIAKELGMDEEEILRLCQISGLEDIFKDDDFSKSWNIEDSYIDDFEPLTDEITEYEKQTHMFRTVNTSDKSRIFHTFDKWECNKAGFYKTTPPEGMTKEDCKLAYRELLTNEESFRKALSNVIDNWNNSCEHYLTNKAMNRIAWLGQAALCYDTGISSEFRSGFNLLTKEEQDKANEVAFEYLNIWAEKNGYEEVTFDEAFSTGRQVEIY